MSNFCEKEMQGLRFVRIGNEVRVAEDVDIRHRELIEDILGDDFTEEQIKERLKNQAEETDMGFVMRIDGQCMIGGESTTFKMPEEDLLPRVRNETLEILGERYPNIDFVSV